MLKIVRPSDETRIVITDLINQITVKGVISGDWVFKIQPYFQIIQKKKILQREEMKGD